MSYLDDIKDTITALLPAAHIVVGPTKLEATYTHHTIIVQWNAPRFAIRARGVEGSEETTDNVKTTTGRVLARLLTKSTSTSQNGAIKSKLADMTSSTLKV